MIPERQLGVKCHSKKLDGVGFRNRDTSKLDVRDSRVCGFRSHQQLLRFTGLESDAPAFSPLFKTLEAGLQGGSHVMHIVLHADEAVEGCVVCKGT